MNRAEVKAMFPDITEEQLKWIMDTNGNDVNAAKSSLAEQLEASNASVDALKAQVEEYSAQRQQNLTKEEQLEQTLAELRAKQVETQMGYNRMSAASILSSLGLDEKSLDSVLDMVVKEDLESTNANAEAIAGLIGAVKEVAASNAVKSAQANVTKPQGGTTGTGITKDEFDKMTYQQKVALYEESPETYKELSSKE